MGSIIIIVLSGSIYYANELCNFQFMSIYTQLATPFINMYYMPCKAVNDTVMLGVIKFGMDV